MSLRDRAVSKREIFVTTLKASESLLHFIDPIICSSTSGAVFISITVALSLA